MRRCLSSTLSSHDLDLPQFGQLTISRLLAVWTRHWLDVRPGCAMANLDHVANRQAHGYGELLGKLGLDLDPALWGLFHDCALSRSLGSS